MYEITREATQDSAGESDAVNEVNREMKSKLLLAATLSALLSFAAFAQDNNGGIKQDTKDAAHSTGQAAKKTGKKVKKGTKKAVHSTAKETRKGADKVEDKTAPK